MRKLFSVFFFVVLLTTTIFSQANLDIPLTASDGINTNDWLAIGVDTSATNGIDPQLGESDLPPFPPAGTFEVRFDLTPYAGEPLSSYQDYRNAPALPFAGDVEYKLIWQLSTGASIFEISYDLPPEVTINVKDLAGGILFDSGILSGTGTYSVPPAFIGLNAAYITMTVVGPCPITQASDPNPTDLHTDVQITGISLGWVNGTAADEVEVWFGPNGRALKLYDGGLVNSWPLGTLNYGTTYSWYIVCKNDSCGIQSTEWTFTTVQDTNVVIDSILVYPQNLNNWTGSCNTSSKTQVSLVNGYNTEVGWMVFDVTAIPNNVTINSVEFNGYLYENSWPYWSITPMGNVNPITDAASVIFNQISTHSGQGIAYSFNEETGTLSNDWTSRNLGSTVTLDLQNSLSKNWFAIGILDVDFSTNYYVKFQGWAETNKPYLKVIYSFHGQNKFQFSLNVANTWNLISIPGLLPGDQLTDDWFPFRDASANVFKFDGVYQSVNSLTPGVGYWMKNLDARTYDTGDEWPAEGIQIVRHDPINASTDWNLFGAYEEIVSASDLTTIPSGLINGPVYGYSGGYFISPQLIPGHGYWVKLSGDAQIVIPDASLKINNEEISWIKDDWGKIIFKDASGVNYTLYAANGNVNLNQYELPPVPPQGMFDIRFESNRIAENVYGLFKTINLNSVTYPLSLKVEGIELKVMDEEGKLVNVNLKNGEQVIIDNPSVNKLMVTGELIPDKYVLEQNYPNPFNPSTVIEFSLPENVSNARLSIYNILGEKITELVNSSLAAGRYQFKWNANNVASGMYIYELITEKFVSTKKMVFMK